MKFLNRLLMVLAMCAVPAALLPAQVRLSTLPRITSTNGLADSSLFLCNDSTNTRTSACTLLSFQKRLAFKQFDTLKAKRLRVDTVKNSPVWLTAQTFVSGQRVDSATGSARSQTLTTVRTIFGQSFNGSANVTGALTATTGTFTAGVTVPAGTTAVQALTATSGTFSRGSAGAEIARFTDNANQTIYFKAPSAGHMGFYDGSNTQWLDQSSAGVTFAAGITAAGNVTSTAGNMVALSMVSASGGTFAFTSRGGLTGVGDGIFTLANNATTDFTRLQLGGVTSAFPAISRSGTAIGIVLADNSGLAPLFASRLIASTDISSAVALGTFSNGSYSSSDLSVTTAIGALVSNSTTSASGVKINLKSQSNQTVATTGTLYGQHNWTEASHTSGTVAVITGFHSTAIASGSGGTTTTANAIQTELDVSAGATVGDLNAIRIIAPSIIGTVTGNVRAINIGNMGTTNTRFAMTTGTGLVQLGDQLILAASTTSRAPLRFATGGSVPSAPLEGEIWYDGTNLKFRDATTTRIITWTP